MLHAASKDEHTFFLKPRTASYLFIFIINRALAGSMKGLLVQALQSQDTTLTVGSLLSLIRSTPAFAKASTGRRTSQEACPP